MKPLIIMFILCGKPDVFIGHDKGGMFVGSLHARNDPVTTSRVINILRDREAIKRKFRIEEILGGYCA